ncbi:MAG TPA: LysM peptidoglycan-binding domain-containing M23 family metallopeptidase [Candidatus Omnitrophota bacterium]|nr:LysM peptidoglycan-binding domain-containing M23 family metallopeptidase [Candidatus Omnitrophota bacterium]HPD83908.1 LysM peptidoglycan-binding domain-containing M23 family metallopeptidase [Candidatus Omnitrophota bacterium]HRZ02765.1 LysM peptidoglycan-binding domain-containing M23 family metallopeptidase [Candidatus Omnitrophota bacterium]
MGSFKRNILSLFLAAAMVQLYGCAAVEYKTLPEAVEPPQGIYHKVQPKETLWRIAKMYNVDIEDLIRYNNIPNAARIEKDQLIFIPGAKQSRGAEPATTVGAARGNDFDWPVKGDVALYFGEQRDGSMNNGVDIRTSAGEPVRASRDGKVVFADYLGGYGQTIILDHADGYFTVYAQNANLTVKLGDSVAQGALIARVGERAPKASLHFEVRKGSQAVNPLYYLP